MRGIITNITEPRYVVELKFNQEELKAFMSLVSMGRKLPNSNKLSLLSDKLFGIIRAGADQSIEWDTEDDGYDHDDDL